MQPKKELPKGSEEMACVGEYILVKYMINGHPYYSIYNFYDSENGRYYFPLGGGSRDLEQVKHQLERITGVKQLSHRNTKISRVCWIIKFPPHILIKINRG
jgi:hypothetical protein